MGLAIILFDQQNKISFMQVQSGNTINKSMQSLSNLETFHMDEFEIETKWAISIWCENALKFQRYKRA